jgi:hypothetical protein
MRKFQRLIEVTVENRGHRCYVNDVSCGVGSLQGSSVLQQALCMPAMLAQQRYKFSNCTLHVHFMSYLKNHRLHCAAAEQRMNLLLFSAAACIRLPSC